VELNKEIMGAQHSTATLSTHISSNFSNVLGDKTK